MFVQRVISTSALALLVIGSGCAADPPLRPIGEPSETQAQRCARLKSAPHTETLPQRIEGEAAVLTPEGRAAGIKDSVLAECILTARGRLAMCRMADSVPLSLQLSVGAALQVWRFRPATYDGVPVATSLKAYVPLVDPPPGWSAPQEVPAGVLYVPKRRLPPQAAAIPLEEDMTPPQLVAGSSFPAYPEKAREMCSEGKVVARCTLTEEGLLIDCDILQSVPYLDQSVLANLAQRRYTPALYRGKPQRIYYTLPFNFRLP